jgi:hydroxyacylglutathione hydrolase
MSSKASTTVGFERRYNHALLEDHDEFVGLALGPQPPRPPNMERIVELNRGPFVGAPPPLGAVADAGDAIVLDVRSVRAFAEGHRAGAVNVPVSGSSFATKTAFVLPDRPVVVHASDEEEALRAVRSLNAVGIFDIAGWQPGGGDERVEPVSIDELEQLLASGEIEVLDVREVDERDAGFIPGTDHMPYRNVRQAAENGLMNGKPVVTICESGARAAVAASVLRAVGVDARPVLGTGIAEWRARGGEVASFRRCGGGH